MQKDSLIVESESQMSSLVTYTPCIALDKSPISVASPSQKDIDVIVLGDDSTLKYIRLEDGIPTTTKWQSDGKWFSDTPIMFSTRRSRVELFAPTPYGKVFYQETRTGLLLKEHWESIGDTITSPLTGVSWGPNRLDVFGLGKDGRVLHKTLTNGHWLPSKVDWEDLGGSFLLPPQVVSTIPGRLDIFCVKRYNSALYHKWWDGSNWNPSATEWAVRGEIWRSPPTVVVTARDRIDLFMRTYGKVYHGVLKDNDWTFQWWVVEQPEEGVWISRPAAVFSKAGRIELFCVRNDHELYHRAFLVYENRWEPKESWKSLGGDFDSAPTALSCRNGEVYVFCKGYDEEIYYMNLDDEEWESLGYAD
jgi:hypothetical protein